MLRGVWVPVATEGWTTGQFVMGRGRVVTALVGGVLWVGVVVAALVVVRWCGIQVFG
jgi:hypothetical protein